jgi:hypothetical protein
MLEDIPGFPQSFMDRHMNWHMAMPPDGRAIPQGQPGSGAEFLDFHHQFTIDVKNWYATQPGNDPSKMIAWGQFPSDLANAHSPELSDFELYAANASNFTTEDALGIYVEAEHNLVHSYIADYYGQPEFAAFDSCMYFMFYQWHGLIDAWRGSWLVHHKRAVKDVLDSNGGHKIILDKTHHKELIADTNIKHLVDITKHIEVPPKGPKELVEVPQGGTIGDPVELLADRVARLESTLHRRAFIRPQERPEVG